MSLDIHLEDRNGHEVFASNISHNFTGAAKAFGLYECIWHPEEKFPTARSIVNPLREGLLAMMFEPWRLKQSMGDGVWEDLDEVDRVFVPWCLRYFRACCTFPDAKVVASP